MNKKALAVGIGVLAVAGLGYYLYSTQSQQAKSQEWFSSQGSLYPNMATNTPPSQSFVTYNISFPNLPPVNIPSGENVISKVLESGVGERKGGTITENKASYGPSKVITSGGKVTGYEIGGEVGMSIAAEKLAEGLRKKEPTAIAAASQLAKEGITISPYSGTPTTTAAAQFQLSSQGLFLNPFTKEIQPRW